MLQFDSEANLANVLVDWCRLGYDTLGNLGEVISI